MAAKLRFGILGTGNIARQFAAGVRQSRRCLLAAVGSRSASSAQAFAAHYQVEKVADGYQALVGDPSIDAVYNSLPNSLHHPWTLAALRAGKHVLCEKPIGVNAREAEEMFAAAASARRGLVEAFMYRSHPLTLAVVEAVRRGDIGRLRLIRTSFCFRTTQIDGNIRFSPPLAGGSLMDIGCYCINFSRLHAAAEPCAMHAVGRLHPNGVDEYAAGGLAFPGGVIASFACGMTLQADNSAYLCGDEGFIQIPIPWKPPADDSTFILTRSSPPRMDNPKSVLAPSAQPREVHKIPVDGELYGIEADDFAATVLDGRPPRLSRDDSVGNMRVLDELRRQVGVKFED